MGEIWRRLIAYVWDIEARLGTDLGVHTVHAATPLNRLGGRSGAIEEQFHTSFIV